MKILIFIFTILSRYLALGWVVCGCATAYPCVIFGDRRRERRGKLSVGGEDDTSGDSGLRVEWRKRLGGQSGQLKAVPAELQRRKAWVCVYT